ncbi:F/Y rich C-terminus-domain-containing protein [Dichotomocladium elegans]|nr:F/Y rich C-terminus-domain-containing protein [Dichotomocladium elegans]
MTDPTKNTVIVSTILDGGDGPLFQVVAEDMPDEPIIANSATGAWTVVVRRSNEIRRREHSNSASGPDYYGFKHPTIAKLIQDLPDTEKLKYYIRQDFEEMEPRAAKGVMAAALKKRGNLEQMGNANVRAPKNASSALTTVARRDEEEPPPALVHPALFNNILLDADDCQQ